ncbi:MAG: O-antigen ligase family protein [Proteobacteria bacterium]|nr:O-antigen ligase family protein [Pseudomonadota bacterium]
MLLILATGLAVYATVKQFIMIDEFALLLFGVLSMLAVGQIDGASFKRSIFSPLSIAFLVYLAYYIFRLDLNLQDIADLDISPNRIPLEIAALFIYYITLMIASSLRPRSHVFYFFFWFLAITTTVNTVISITDFDAIRNKNFYAYQAITFMPLLHIALLRNMKLCRFLMVALAVLVLFVFESRAGFVAIVFYHFTFAAWPVVSRNRKRLLAGLIGLLALVVALIYIYTFVLENIDITAFTEFNEKIFDKGILGRLYIWQELIKQISMNFYLGLCSNCNTEFFMGGLLDRNLSSHSTFLEHLFRGGVVALLLLLIVLFRIADLCYRYRSSAYARICFSYLATSICIASAYEFIFFSVLTVNFIFWLGIGFLWNAMRHDIVLNP